MKIFEPVNKWRLRDGRWAIIASSIVLLLNLGATIPAAAERRVFISIPILAVTSDDETAAGSITTLAIEIERQNAPAGLIIEYNEGSRAFGAFRGRAMEEDSKDSARTAVLTASKLAGEDAATLRVTFKAVSNAYLIGGPSASGSIAVAILAALRGITILPGIVMTGAIDRDGRILSVGGLPTKLAAAAAAGLTTVLIPGGQAHSKEWDLGPLAERLNITIVEVATVSEAYERMTGHAL